MCVCVCLRGWEEGEEEGKAGFLTLNVPQRREAVRTDSNDCDDGADEEE